MQRPVCFSEDFAMRKLFTGCAAALLAAAFVAPGTFQSGMANAAPIFVPKTATAQSDVIQVRDGWHRGYRGYRHYRHGYRNYNGWWYPAGAFVAGALIGGAIANSNSYYGSRYYDGYYPRSYAPSQVYYPSGGSAYRQGYRDGFRDGANARYRSDITCTSRLQDAGKC